MQDLADYIASLEGVSAFRPPHMSERAARRAAALSVPRAPLGVTPGWTVKVMPQRDAELWSEAGAPVEIIIRIGGETAHLRTVRPLIERLLRAFEPGIEPEKMGAELAAYALEAALRDPLEALERKLDRDVAFMRLARTQRHSGGARLDFMMNHEDTPSAYPCALFGPSSVVGLISEGWLGLPARYAAAPSACATIAVRVGFCDLSRRALRLLKQGDVVTFDRAAPNSGVVYVLAERFCAVGVMDNSGALILSKSFADPDNLTGEFIMSDETAEGGPPPAIRDADLAKLPVRLTFELGRVEMTMDELRNLGVGAPVPVDRTGASGVDILANGRRIGVGDIVMIGDRIGVRVTRLNADA